MKQPSRYVSAHWGKLTRANSPLSVAGHLPTPWETGQRYETRGAACYGKLQFRATPTQVSRSARRASADPPAAARGVGCSRGEPQSRGSPLDGFAPCQQSPPGCDLPLWCAGPEECRSVRVRSQSVVQDRDGRKRDRRERDRRPLRSILKTDFGCGADNRASNSALIVHRRSFVASSTGTLGAACIPGSAGAAGISLARGGSG